jgi:hypothetical protein
MNTWLSGLFSDGDQPCAEMRRPAPSDRVMLISPPPEAEKAEVIENQAGQ